MSLSQLVVIAGLIAVTIPLVVSVFATFDPRTRVKTIDDYFLYAKSLDLDGFLKASIGYSLQAASIALFFLWALSYGVRAVFVAIAWCIGYFVVAACVRAGRFDRFLEASRAVTVTIHGYIGKFVATQSPILLRLIVMLVAAATIIGLGGTMIVEIDYGTKLTLNTLGIPTTEAATSVRETVIHIIVLVFVLFYVISGGYRAVVLTERYQVPAAYVSFVGFGIGVLVLLGRLEQFRSLGLWMLVALVSCLVGILSLRLWLFAGASLSGPATDEARSAKTTAWLTFLPIIALGLFGVLVASLGTPIAAPGNVVATIPPDAYAILWPETAWSFGFGVAGALSLFAANVVWQLIDISSLQRLQSISAQLAERGARERIASALQVVGAEAGIGWTLIIIVGLALRGLGADKPESIGTILMSFMGAGHLLAGVVVPAFLFAVSVFMLSTISGFMSALSYVTYYDLVGASDANAEKPIIGTPTLGIARRVTFMVVVFIYLGYVALKAGMPNEKVPAALYAIYAFQLTLLPVLLWVFFRDYLSISNTRTKIHPVAVSVSILLGFAVATFTALRPDLLAAYMEEDSTYVFPPLAVIVCAGAFFLVLNWALPQKGRNNGTG